MLIGNKTPSTLQSKAREQVSTNNITQSQTRGIIMVHNGLTGLVEVPSYWKTILQSWGAKNDGID